jgi:hypothetical protein
MRHVVAPELPRALVAGAGATTHAVVPELACARRREPRPQARGGPGAATGPGGRSWSYEARGGSEAARQEMGAAGHAGMCARLVFHL